MKKNDVYKGFRVLEAIPVEEYDSTGFFLRHEKSGLEVFHLLNSDKENLFAFAFRTPPKDSTGAAHVLEHSVLCGSKKYPVKDPFLQLTKQSINTYLNAFTAADRTVFPSSSLIKADYFNIMSVYADAVFFPLLRPEVFAQECWRLEPDEDGNYGIQGVVFNEMKGNYSSYNSVAGDLVGNALFPDTMYSNDSGGDPLVIPTLTLEKLKAFHKKYYCTANCLVFLYGNIPTEEQLDFLDENVVGKVSDYGKKVEFHDRKEKPPVENFTGYAPSDDEKSSGKGNATVALSWRLGKNIRDSELNTSEIAMLSDLLFGSDSAPVRKALLKKFPKSAVSPLSSSSITTFYNSFTLAFAEMDESCAKEFRDTVYSVLEELSEKGFDGDDIERAMMDFKIRFLEVKRNVTGGPYSISILRQVLRAWTYGMEPWKFIFIKRETDSLNDRILEDGDYLKKLVRKYFLDNKETSLAVILRSPDYMKLRDEKERKIAEDLFGKIGKEKADSILVKMRAFQSLQSEDENAIPSVKVEDLEPIDDGIKIKKSLIKGVPFYFSEEPCNGIVYASIAFPVDCLKPEDYLYLPLMEETVTEMGWGSLSWEKASALSDRLTGMFSAGVRRAPVSECNRKYMEENPLLVGREWLSFKFKFIEEKTDEVFAMVSDCILGVDFSDSKRLKSIIFGACSGIASHVVPNAHYYTSLRSMRTMNRLCAIREIMEGITCLKTFESLKKMDMQDVGAKLSRMFSAIKKSGAVLHVTGTRQGIALAKKGFAFLVDSLGLTYPKAKRKTVDRDFIKLTELEGTVCCKKNPAVDEVFIIPGNIGFAGKNVSSSPLGTSDYVADTVTAHLLEKSDLWTKIRMAGGAYGVFMNVSGDFNSTRYITYRDPKPFDSLETFDAVLEGLDGRSFSREDAEKAICGVYADEIEPVTPQSRGACSLMRVLYGGSSRAYKKLTEKLLKTTEKDLKKACMRYKKAEKMGETVVFCGKSLISKEIKEKCGKIIKLKI